MQIHCRWKCRAVEVQRCRFGAVCTTCLSLKEATLYFGSTHFNTGVLCSNEVHATEITAVNHTHKTLRVSQLSQSPASRAVTLKTTFKQL